MIQLLGPALGLLGLSESDDDGSFGDNMEEMASNIPIIGGFFGDSPADLSEKQQERYQQLHDQYMAQRQPARAARMQALKQTLGLFQPMTELMQRQYGTDFDYGSLLQDPTMARGGTVRQVPNEYLRENDWGNIPTLPKKV